MKKLATVLFLLLPLFSYAEGIYDLRTEHLREPMGMDAANPRFSWKMETAGRFRKEFQVRGRITKARAYIAYKLASGTEFPSWGHWIAGGRTTLAENWKLDAGTTVTTIALH